MENICEICKKNPVKISINGKHSYCLDCYNKIALKDIGIEDTFAYAKFMSVVEPGGSIHTFEIEHVVLGEIVSWEANEKGGDYHFNLISNPGDNGSEVAKRFFKKIVNGVCNKSLEENKGKGDTSYYLKSKGNILLTEDEDRDYDTAFVIDGIKFNPDEFAKLVNPYVGFNIQFQIKDNAELLLGENEYLVPVKITEKELLQELETALAVTTDKVGFLSYKNVPTFDELFYKIIKKLRILSDAMEKDKALIIGRAMAKRLREVEHDDDWFPYGNIDNIIDTVDPYRLDEELLKYLDGDGYI